MPTDTELARKKHGVPEPGLFPDRENIPFDEYLHHMPDRVSDWSYRNVKEDHGAIFRFKSSFFMHPCWMCGEKPEHPKNCHDLHHLFAGSRGKSEQPSLYTLACRDCHMNKVGEEWLGRWLYLKWYFDRENTLWTTCAARHGRALPDLDIPEELPVRRFNEYD